MHANAARLYPEHDLRRQFSVLMTLAISENEDLYIENRRII